MDQVGVPSAALASILPPISTPMSALVAWDASFVPEDGSSGPRVGWYRKLLAIFATARHEFWRSAMLVVGRWVGRLTLCVLAYRIWRLCRQKQETSLAGLSIVVTVRFLA